MKKLHYLGIILLTITISYTANAQVQSLNEMSITPPTYQSSEFDNLSDYFQRSIQYPAKSVNGRLQGTEVIRFSVSGTGKIEDITVINSISKEIDNEVIAVLKETYGSWIPGAIDGRQTTMSRELALSFVLISYDNMLNTARNYVQKGNKFMFAKNKPEKALTQYNLAYSLIPYDPSLQSIREICLLKLGRDEDVTEIRDNLGSLAKQDQNVTDPLFPDERIRFDEPITIAASLYK
jgi:hypothetical protein